MLVKIDIIQNAADKICSHFVSQYTIGYIFLRISYKDKISYMFDNNNNQKYMFVYFQ